MNYYDSIENLPIYNFDKYKNQNNVNWFIKDFDGRQTIVKNADLIEIEKKILDEYFKALDDRTFQNKIRKSAEIQFLKTKYSMALTLLVRVSQGFTDMETRLLFIKELSKYGYKLPEINTYDGDLLVVQDLIFANEGLKTKINILQSEITTEQSSEPQSLIKQMQILSLGLQYSYRLNPKEITVEEFIEMSKLLEEKNKKN